MSDEHTGFFRANRDLVVIATLAVLVTAVYFRATGFDFINLDDNNYVYENPAVLSGVNWTSFKWALTAFYAANWHPVTWLSHQLDIQLFGADPGAQHAVNIVFHLMNSILAFVVFRKMTGCYWRSAIVATLFAVHPAHVESVAWISERKDLISTMFWLLTMWAYFRYTQLQSGEHRWGEIFSYRYLLIVVLFALGLMTKPMLVTLPFVLLLCDLWPLERIRGRGDLQKMIVEKVPLFVLSAGSCYATVLAQRSAGAVQSLTSLPLATRLENAVVSYGRYLIEAFYPANLAVWYPYQQTILAWQIAASATVLIVITAFCILRMKDHKYLLVGWLWFIGTLVPVIGIVQVGSQSMADRYTYIPYFGLFVMVVWGTADLLKERRMGRPIGIAIASVVVTVLCIMSFRQVSFWLNSETLYRHTLSVTKNNWLIAGNLCHHYVVTDRLDEAEPLCRNAITIKPDSFEPHNSLGILQFKRGLFSDAEESFKTAVSIWPQYSFGHANLAQAQSQLGKADEAEESLRRAVELSGGAANDAFASALSDIAVAYAAKGENEKALDNLLRLIYIQPENTHARLRLALTLYLLKRYDEAAMAIDDVLKGDEGNPTAHNIAGMILIEKGDRNGAARHFQRAVELKPDYDDAKANLKKARGNK